jgi:hypothetical protein
MLVALLLIEQAIPGKQLTNKGDAKLTLYPTINRCRWISVQILNSIQNFKYTCFPFNPAIWSQQGIKIKSHINSI